jgi:hypothetical protein
VFVVSRQAGDLFLPGDVGYNVEHLFSNEARMALRLSHFLSNFLQNVDMYEEYGNLRGDLLLNTEQIFGEVNLLDSFFVVLNYSLFCLSTESSNFEIPTITAVAVYDFAD